MGVISSRILKLLDFRSFPRKRKIHFLINICLGLLIAMAFHFLEHTVRGEDMINMALDYFVLKDAYTSAEAAGKLSEAGKDRVSGGMVFVDIDDRKYREWGSPLITPRNELARIVKAANLGGAKVIVLDVLLENKDCCSRECDDKCTPGGDETLKKVFQEMVDKKTGTKVIFPVTLVPDNKAGKGPLKIRENIYADLIKKNHDFYIAAPYISAGGSDRLFRYWVPYKIIDDGGTNKVLWNVALLAAVAASDKMTDLRQMEERILSQKLSGPYHIQMENRKVVTVYPEDELDIYGNRIRYFIVPKDTVDGYPGGNLSVEAVCDADEKQMETMNFRDKVVIIGNSSPDAGDMHPTPVGKMAGMYIIGNAANTIMLGLQPSRESALLKYLIEAAVIIIAAYLFLYFQSLLAHILGSAVMLLFLGLISYYYFQYTGTFLNFTFAVAGMGLHRTLSDFEEIIEKKGVKGHDH